jgi:hypothetical protein
VGPGVGGGVLFAEPAESAETVHTHRLGAGGHPGNKVHIMAALCHKHTGAAIDGVAPFATDKTGGEMVIAHIFSGGKGDHFSDLAVKDTLFDLGIERRIAQNVADHHHFARLFLSRAETVQLVKADGNRFFQKDVISLFKKRNRGGDMEFIHGAVDDGIGKFGLGTQLFNIVKEHGIVKIELLLDRCPAVGKRVHNACDLELLRMLVSILGITQGTMTCADNDCFYHFFNLLKIFFKMSDVMLLI